MHLHDTLIKALRLFSLLTIDMKLTKLLNTCLHDRTKKFSHLPFILFFQMF